MKRFLRWFRVDRAPRAVPENAIPTANAPEATREDENNAVARQVIERLSEDESLRRGLTDDAFKPILDLVTSLVPAVVGRATAQSETAEDLSQAARQLVLGLSAAVASGDPSVVSVDLLHRFMSEDQANEMRRALASDGLPDGPAGERAEALVGTVKSVLSRGRV